MTAIPDHLLFDLHGAQHFPSAALGSLEDIRSALAHLPSDQAGIRLTAIAPLTSLLSPTGTIGNIAAKISGSDCHAVRAIYFDKTAETNWALGWHQDRTIAVRSRIETPGFGPWTVKSGLLHVAPPFDILESMVTLRVHLDDVPDDNAPLLIAPGSHRHGRIAEPDVANVVEQCGQIACTAEAGDVWVYATPILHASEAARNARHRRVLQVDYAVGDLPGGLEWLGV